MTILKKMAVAAALFLPLIQQAQAQQSPVPVVQPKITFLSSIDEATFKGPFYLHWGYFEHYIDGLESMFRDHYKNSGYQLVIKRNANRDELYKALHDPSNVGLFWVSHSALVSGAMIKGLEFSDEIIDSMDSDVKNVFESVHPNMKWLSVVACDSNMILKAEQVDSNPNQKVQGFDYETDARIGLNSAMTQADAVLLSPAVEAGYKGICPEVTGRPVLITRSVSVPPTPLSKVWYPSVTVELNGKAIASFPEITKSQDFMSSTVVENKLVLIPMNAKLTDSSDLDITINTGMSAAEVTPDLDFGSFEFTGFWTGNQWKAFASPKTGKPFGVTKNMYMYQGPLAPDSSMKSMPEFTCADVAPVPTRH